MLGPGNGTRRRHVQAAELPASLDPHRPWGTGDDQRNASPPPKGPPPEPSSSLTLRRSSPASRSFVLAPLRALHLDPGSGRRALRPRGPPTTPTAQRPPLSGDCLDRTSGFTHGVGPG